MLKDVRRRLQLLDEAETLDILNKAQYGTLALIDPDGDPYCVPLNFAVLDDDIIFHIAKAGHKLDAIQANPKACFNAVSESRILEEKFTDLFKSADVFGTLRFLEEDEQKIRALKALCHKYCPSMAEEAIDAEIAGGLNRCLILALSMDQMSGKQCIEFVRKDKNQ